MSATTDLIPLSLPARFGRAKAPALWPVTGSWTVEHDIIVASR